MVERNSKPGEIEGKVFMDEPRSKVQGSAFTDRFIFKKPGKIFQKRVDLIARFPFKNEAI